VLATVLALLPWCLCVFQALVFMNLKGMVAHLKCVVPLILNLKGMVAHLNEFEGYGGSFEMCGASHPLKGLRSAVVEGCKVLARWT